MPNDVILLYEVQSIIVKLFRCTRSAKIRTVKWQHWTPTTLSATFNSDVVVVSNDKISYPRPGLTYISQSPENGSKTIRIKATFSRSFLRSFPSNIVRYDWILRFRLKWNRERVSVLANEPF